VRFSHVRFGPRPYEIHGDFTASRRILLFSCTIWTGSVDRQSHDVPLCVEPGESFDQIDNTGLPVSDQTLPAAHRPW